jgi:hypothetical protein
MRQQRLVLHRLFELRVDLARARLIAHLAEALSQ